MSVHLLPQIHCDRHGCDYVYFPLEDGGYASDKVYRQRAKSYGWIYNKEFSRDYCSKDCQQQDTQEP
jgi:hypothetical protein